jgi:hypothetical protein
MYGGIWDHTAAAPPPVLLAILHCFVWACRRITCNSAKVAADSIRPGTGRAIGCLWHSNISHSFRAGSSVAPEDATTCWMAVISPMQPFCHISTTEDGRDISRADRQEPSEVPTSKDPPDCAVSFGALPGCHGCEQGHCLRRFA